jgi:hypothetical protein
MARKPRDYDAELQALMERAKKVKTQKTTQLGELVQVVGADALPMEALAGALQDRRARTRHLIELGGLIQKAGLVDLVDDDRATLLGAFLELAARMSEQEDERQGVSQADQLARWRRRGLRAFEADREAAETEALGRRKEDGQPGEVLQL